MVKYFQFAYPINKLIHEDESLRRMLENHHKDFLLGFARSTYYPNDPLVNHILERHAQMERDGETVNCFRFF